MEQEAVITVTGLRSVGAAFRRGMLHRGWHTIFFSDGSSEWTPNGLSWDGAIDYAIANKQRVRELMRLPKVEISGDDYKQRLDVWVKTGQMPAAKETNA